MKSTLLKLSMLLLVGFALTVLQAQQAQSLKQKNEKEDIFEAVDAGDLNEVRVLIEADPSLLESKDDNGFTPLHKACFFGKVAVTNFLIDKGADVNNRDGFNQTPLHRACNGSVQDLDLIKRLLDKGADVNSQGTNGITPLHWAARSGDLKVAKLLLDHGADVNIHDKYSGTDVLSSISGTVLQVAINYSPNEEMAKLIIEQGAKLNRKDSQDNTELHLAALKGSADLASLLIGHGADVNAVNGYGRTALYYAAKHGYRSVVEALTAAGAKKNTIVETNYGKAPQLTATLKDGEAYLWSLGDWSYAVKTKRNLLVFTGGNNIKKSPEEAGLANGRLNPDELAGQKITMFINHMDRWQMGAKDFGQLAKLVPGIELVSSFKPDFSKEENPDIPAYRLALPNESFSVSGIKVHTIQALASGLGYLVEVDGVKIFHAGLHISDNEPAHVEKFRKEVDFLKPFGPIDIVFLTVHSHSNRVGMDYVHHLYLLDQLAPKVIYLFGANIPATYMECADVLRMRNIPVIYPEVKQADGERYHYLRERTRK